jgi:pilus assembly protein FimV
LRGEFDDVVDRLTPDAPGDAVDTLLPAEEPQVERAAPAPLTEPQAAPAVEPTPPLSFELELPATDAVQHTVAAGEVDAPAPAEVLDTRFALVDECRAIGDLEMARDLLREIAAEGDDASRQRAQAMLAELG